MLDVGCKLTPIIFDATKVNDLALLEFEFDRETPSLIGINVAMNVFFVLTPGPTVSRFLTLDRFLYS